LQCVGCLIIAGWLGAGLLAECGRDSDGWSHPQDNPAVAATAERQVTLVYFGCPVRVLLPVPFSRGKKVEAVEKKVAVATTVK
jgi:hypothetical protein